MSAPILSADAVAALRDTSDFLLPTKARALCDSHEALRALLVRVAETQMNLAVIDATMGRAAFDEDGDAPSQDDRDWFAEAADDALASVSAWWEGETASPATPPTPSLEARP